MNEFNDLDPSDLPDPADLYGLDDEIFENAEEEIRNFFNENREGVYYTRQLQVLFEKKYFHWITYRVLGYLKDLGELNIDRRGGGEENPIYFYSHRSNRYRERKIKNLERIIREFSLSNITRSCGRLAENLFCVALAKRGFRIIGEKITEFNEKKWEKSGHDLDYIFGKDGIFYGCEIKNSLGYIEKKELDIKIEMCKFLGMSPLFIMRYAPKHYLNNIWKANGLFIIFETKIYDYSQVDLVNRIKNNLGLPVICSGAIPDGIIDRFERAHLNKINVNSKKIHKDK